MFLFVCWSFCLLLSFFVFWVLFWLLFLWEIFVCVFLFFFFVVVVDGSMNCFQLFITLFCSEHPVLSFGKFSLRTFRSVLSKESTSDPHTLFSAQRHSFSYITLFLLEMWITSNFDFLILNRSDLKNITTWKLYCDQKSLLKQQHRRNQTWLMNFLVHD